MNYIATEEKNRCFRGIAMAIFISVPIWYLIINLALWLI